MYYDEITVGQFCHFYIEDSDKVRIWDLDLEKVLFEGTYYEAQRSKYANKTICSFGIEDGINCINI